MAPVRTGVLPVARPSSWCAASTLVTRGRVSAPRVTRTTLAVRRCRCGGAPATPTSASSCLRPMPPLRVELWLRGATSPAWEAAAACAAEPSSVAASDDSGCGARRDLPLPLPVLPPLLLRRRGATPKALPEPGVGMVARGDLRGPLLPVRRPRRRAEARPGWCRWASGRCDKELGGAGTPTSTGPRLCCCCCWRRSCCWRWRWCMAALPPPPLCMGT